MRALTKRPVLTRVIAFRAPASILRGPHEQPNPTFANSDAAEIAKFEAAAHRFWDVDGEFKPLHKLNPVRARYVAGTLHARAARVCSTWDAAADCSPNACARRRAGHGHRSRAEHGGNRAPARARFRASPSTIASRTPPSAAEAAPANSTWSPAWKCSSTCPIRRRPWLCSASWCGPAAMCSFPPSIAISSSFALAIVGAEYVANLVPRGTHEYDRLLKPSEVARFARAAGLEVMDIAGLQYDPLREQCSLDSNPSVNYLMHLTRLPAQGLADESAPSRPCCSTSTARCSTPRRISTNR